MSKIIEEYFDNWFEVSFYLRNLGDRLIEFGDVSKLDICIRYISNLWRLTIYADVKTIATLPEEEEKENENN